MLKRAIIFEILRRYFRMMTNRPPYKRLIQFPEITGCPVIVKIKIMSNIKNKSLLLNEANNSLLPHPIIQHGSSSTFLPETHPVRQIKIFKLNIVVELGGILLHVLNYFWFIIFTSDCYHFLESGYLQNHIPSHSIF